MKVHACRLLKSAMGHYISALRLRGVNVFEEISRVLFNYGELKNARAMANVIVTARKDKEIRKSEVLAKTFFS